MVRADIRSYQLAFGIRSGLLFSLDGEPWTTLSGWWFEPIPGHIGPQDPAQPSQCRILVDVVSSQTRPIQAS
jgi:hypothetical protein